MVDKNDLVWARLMLQTERCRWFATASFTAGLGRSDKTENRIGDEKNRNGRSQSNQETAHHNRVVEIRPWNERKGPCCLSSLLQLWMGQYEVADFMRIRINFDRKESDTCSGQTCHCMIDLQ